VAGFAAESGTTATADWGISIPVVAGPSANTGAASSFCMWFTCHCGCEQLVVVNEILDFIWFCGLYVMCMVTFKLPVMNMW
jgi:nicotinamide mononucleotide (NMN) deamidase PncC